MSEMAERELPEGWTLKPIGELVQPTRPRVSPSEKPDLPFLGMDHIEAQTMRLLGSVPASSMKSSAVHFQPGDVLYGRLRPYLNKVFQPAFEGLCSAEFIVFPEADELDNKYLQYFLNSSGFVRYATSLNSGDRPRVKFEQFASHCIPLPPTVDEQKRIVAKIEELFSHIDAGVEGLKKTQRLLKQYRQSVLKAAVTGEILGDNFSSEIYKPIEYGLKSLWQGWSPKCDKEPSPSEEIWGVIKTTAIQALEYLQNENKQLPKNLTPRIGLEIIEGDILITRAGPRVRVGVCCLVRKTRKKLMICDKVYRLRTNSDKILPEYLEIILNSPQIQALIEELKSGINDSGLNLTQKCFVELKIPYPTLQNQEKIIKLVYDKNQAITRLERELEVQSIKAERNKQSIFSAAFSGNFSIAKAACNEY